MGVINIDSPEHFLRNLGTGPAVVDFWAEFCGPCRRIAPEYEALSNAYPNIKFFKCDTRGNGSEVADSHGVRALPTFVFYKGGQELKEHRFEGADMTKLEGVLSKIGTVETFTGEGNRLGGEEWEAPPPEAFHVPLNVASEQVFPNPIEVDPTKPKSKIQFRFHDGSKNVQEFNHGHHICDIFLYVGHRDGFSSNFILKTGFPPKKLEDTGETLEEAKLLGSQIVHQLIK